MEADIHVYFQMIYKRLWMVMIMVILACGGTVAYDVYVATPVYEASTKLIVNTANRDAGVNRPDANEINSNIMLIETYKGIIRTPVIMEKVADEYPEFGMQTKELIANVKIDTSTTSQIMGISIQSTSPEFAVGIVNAISAVFKREIPSIIHVDNVTILSEAKLEDHLSPVSVSVVFKVVIAFVLSLMGSIVLIFLREYMNDTIRTEEDIHKYLALPMLATITNIKKSDYRGAVVKQSKEVKPEMTQISTNQ